MASKRTKPAHTDSNQQLPLAIRAAAQVLVDWLLELASEQKHGSQESVNQIMSKKGKGKNTGES